MEYKNRLFNKGKINYGKLVKIFQGWNAYAKLANSHNLNKNLIKK